MSSHLYIEGGKTGPHSKQDQILCRKGFRKLLEKAGVPDRRLGLSACGGRGEVFKDFKMAHAKRQQSDYVAMLIDSEDPVLDVEKTWDHLKTRDNWDQPAGADDEQVLFMTTCMETWIVADRKTLQEHYGSMLKEKALPPTNNLESRERADIYKKLYDATWDCSNAYRKGRRSFSVVGKLNPSALEPLLPSFARMTKILKAKL